MRKLLLPFSLFYWLIVAVRNWFFDISLLKSKKVNVPVISVGNISAGGVGKTPLVELLIEKLHFNGQVSVVSRGYGRKSTGTVVVSDGCGLVSSVEQSGDEPTQLAHKYPELIVVVDEQRVRGAKKAVELGATMILLDDGFQHRYLHRDCNIVTLSAEEILNGDLLLPAGNRREPFSALKRADLIAVTRCADTKEFEHVCDVGREHNLLPVGIPTVGLRTKLRAFKRALTNEIVTTELLTNKKVIAFSGIGNPKSFHNLMIKADINIVKQIDFSDHHWYTERDLKAIIDSRKQANADFIITTEKDAERLGDRLRRLLETEPVIVAEIQLEILFGENKLDELLTRRQ